MHFYRILLEKTGIAPLVDWAPGLASAHAHARTEYRKEDRADLRIELVDVPTDKAGVLALLQDARRGVTSTAPALRTWAITDRGGLREVANGE